MKVIKLPSVLPGDLDLQAVNQQLRDRTAQLDWSAATSAPESALAILLANLDLSNDADLLGLDGAASGNISYQVRLITRNISCIARRLKSLLEGVYATKLYYGHS